MQRAPEKDLCPGGPATDGCPVGSLRRRAPVQGPAGIGARPFDSAEGRFELKLAWFAGVDWGSEKHQVCVLDAAGKVLGEREFEHSGTGLSQMASWVLSLATGDAGEVGVAVETPRGPVVESLMERGFAVHSINPKQLDRFRDRLSPAGAKDDRRDARVLASALRTDAHCLRRLEPTDPAIVELREWSRLSEELTRERVRLANRMRDQLWRYYPQFLDAVDDDVAAPWALDLWQSLPTPRAGQRIREVTLTRVLKQHRIRRIDTATLRVARSTERPRPRPGTWPRVGRKRCGRGASRTGGLRPVPCRTACLGRGRRGAAGGATTRGREGGQDGQGDAVLLTETPGAAEARREAASGGATP